MLKERPLQQSKNWQDYTNGSLKIKNDYLYSEGFPLYTLSHSKYLKFKLLLRDGSIIENATVDDSRQFYSEGRQWNDIRGNTIYEHLVVAWTEEL